MDPLTLESFCKKLPKVELHAHLNGSLSEETMRVLCARKNTSGSISTWEDVVSVFDENDSDSRLDRCFRLFHIAHALTSDSEAVFHATKDVIREFAEDGVMYLELRTTPRAEAGAMSKKQYLDAVIKAIKELQPESNIIVKLLVSVNRQEGREAAKENINEAIEAHKKYPDVIVGVDLSGNPSFGHFEDEFMLLFLQARKAGLKVALHCAEVPNESETQAMLNFGADRLGHGTCIHPTMKGTDTIWNQLLQAKVPLEVCLTSNVKCKTVDGYDKHHLQFLLPVEYPVALSTDDKGVFATSLSKEFQIAAEVFNLQHDDLCRLTGMAIDASFGTAEEKSLMNQKLQEFQNVHCVSLFGK